MVIIQKITFIAITSSIAFDIIARVNISILAIANKNTDIFPIYNFIKVIQAYNRSEEK